MTWILLFFVGVAVATIVFLKLPYSMTQTCFQKDMRAYIDRFGLKNELITDEDIQPLPEPVQKHLRMCGYVGKTKMTVVKAYITSVPLKDSNDKPPMIVDYTLCSFADEPVRLAYIKTSMLGIPFEAYDSTQNSEGFMKGVLGKVVTLFNQKGPEMDKAQLLTYLGECFLIPACLLNRHITWEPIDSTHAKAIINYNGVAGSGIFTFDGQGFVRSFQTDQRAKIGNDGSVEYPKWSLVYGEFRENGGMLYPTELKTIWHDSEGDFVYFDASDIDIVFDH